MAELEADEGNPENDETVSKEEKVIEDTAVKPTNKSLINVTSAMSSEPGSETSSIAPEDEDTLISSDADLKKARPPRKLIEDEKRAKGRIAWPVWRTYFTVSEVYPAM